VSRRRLAIRLAIAASAAAIIAAVAVAFNVPSGGSTEGFNACISQSRFLVLTRHASVGTVTEMISDRARGAVVGEFARFASERAAGGFQVPLAGTGAANGPYAMFTEVPLGRDARTIQLCFGRVFPQPDG